MNRTNIRFIAFILLAIIVVFNGASYGMWYYTKWQALNHYQDNTVLYLVPNKTITINAADNTKQSIRIKTDLAAINSDNSNFTVESLQANEKAVLRNELYTVYVNRTVLAKFTEEAQTENFPIVDLAQLRQAYYATPNDIEQADDYQALVVVQQRLALKNLLLTIGADEYFVEFNYTDAKKKTWTGFILGQTKDEQPQVIQLFVPANANEPDMTLLEFTIKPKDESTSSFNVEEFIAGLVVY